MPFIYKKHEFLLNIIEDFIVFFARYYTHFGALLFSISLKQKVKKAIFKVKQEDITSKQILKRGINEKFNNFLNTI